MFLAAASIITSVVLVAATGALSSAPFLSKRTLWVDRILAVAVGAWLFISMSPPAIGTALAFSAWLAHQAGAPAFWRAAARSPNQCYDWFMREDCWAVVHSGEATPEGFPIGPFLLAVPKLGGQRVRIYGRSLDEVDASEQKLMVMLDHDAGETRPGYRAPYGRLAALQERVLTTAAVLGGGVLVGLFGEGWGSVAVWAFLIGLVLNVYLLCCRALIAGRFGMILGALIGAIPAAAFDGVK